MDYTISYHLTILIISVKDFNNIFLAVWHYPFEIIYVLH